MPAEGSHDALVSLGDQSPLKPRVKSTAPALTMKARLLPVRFPSSNDTKFDDHVKLLRELLGETAEILEPSSLGAPLPETDAVLFPRLVVVPQPFARAWTLRGKVLAIVDENAVAIDARVPLGDLTLSKLDSTLETLVVAEGELTGYAGYQSSDCLNGPSFMSPTATS
jgi:hypothetical protein